MCAKYTASTSGGYYNSGYPGPRGGSRLRFFGDLVSSLVFHFYENPIRDFARDQDKTYKLEPV